MLRKLLHGSAVACASESKNTSTSDSELDSKYHGNESLNKASGVLVLITQLDGLELRLRGMIQNWSKYCQAILG